MSYYETEEIINDIIKLIGFLLGIQIIIFVAWLIQLITNIIIIMKLPKIERYNKRIFQKLYNFQYEDENEVNKNTRNFENKATYDNENFKEATNEEVKEWIIKIIVLFFVAICMTFFLVSFINR